MSKDLGRENRSSWWYICHVWCCRGRYTPPCICPNPQRAALRVDLDVNSGVCVARIHQGRLTHWSICLTMAGLLTRGGCPCLWARAIWEINPAAPKPIKTFLNSYMIQWDTRNREIQAIKTEGCCSTVECVVFTSTEEIPYQSKGQRHSQSGGKKGGILLASSGNQGEWGCTRCSEVNGTEWIWVL